MITIKRNCKGIPKKMSNIITAYFSSKDYDLQSILNALQNPHYINVIESWDTEKIIEKVFPDESVKKKTLNLTEAVIIVDKRDINFLKFYVKVTPHRNMYPLEFQDSRSIYCVFTPAQKIETERILKIFCQKLKINFPRFTPGNGFSFYIFETDDYIPQIFGLLNSYPSLEGAKFRYGLKRNPPALSKTKKEKTSKERTSTVNDAKNKNTD